MTFGYYILLSIFIVLIVGIYTKFVAIPRFIKQQSSFRSEDETPRFNGHQLHNSEETKLIIYCDMDNVLCNYDKAYQTAVAQNPDIKYPQSQYGFFANLEPVEGAIDAIKALADNHDQKVYILTAPSIHNPLCYTEKRVWVEKWLGFSFVERLIFSPNKGLLRGDVLIDDHVDGNGQDKFEGLLIQFGTEAYPNWQSVLQAFHH